MSQAPRLYFKVDAIITDDCTDVALRWYIGTEVFLNVKHHHDDDFIQLGAAATARSTLCSKRKCAEKRGKRLLTCVCTCSVRARVKVYPFPKDQPHTACVLACDRICLLSSILHRIYHQNLQGQHQQAQVHVILCNACGGHTYMLKDSSIIIDSSTRSYDGQRRCSSWPLATLLKPAAQHGQ
eukprot:6173632-Pleurochrysis_carterae.AAC.14